MALVATAGIVGTTPASADIGDQRHCVTAGEFKRVGKGMPKWRVHDIFDTRGVRTSISYGGGTKDEYREYRTCASDPEYSYVDINFDNYSNRRSGMRLYSKHMYISS